MQGQKRGTMPSATQSLLAHGQSPWLDYISRDLLESGELGRMVRDQEITGVTSNPTIFDKAITGSRAYDTALAKARADGITDPYEAFVAIASEDIARACDVLLPVWEDTAGTDGFVSLEIPPGIETDTAATVAEATRLAGLVGRPNLMIKVPGTPEGVRSLEALIAAGINVNQTLLFDTTTYERSAEAYLRGLERRVANGLPVDRVAGVASFFVSRVDTAVDPLLPEGSALRGRAAIANARDAYRRFLGTFSGRRWKTLAEAGARAQRPLWASTGTKNPGYSDVLYVEQLVGPNTVNTLPEATLRAVLDHAAIQPTLEPGMMEAQKTLQALALAGVDMRAVTKQLLDDGLAAFERDFRKLLDHIRDALAAVPVAGA